MISLFRPLYYEPARHIYKLLFRKAYRNYCFLQARFGNTPRFTPCRAKVNGWDLAIPDAASFLSAYKEIFVEGVYGFRFDSTSPRILDLGANIGLSVLYFKRLYPAAHITALEADPKIFAHLVRNVHGNGYTDVELVNQAVWHENATLMFNSEGADGGRAALPGDANLVEVQAVDVRTLLEKGGYDFLKMDIEGAEEFVLPACAEFLPGIRYVFVEYHSKVGRRQSLDRILGTLAEVGFRVHIHTLHPSLSPFIKVPTNSGFDMQLNIFAWREQC